MRLDWFLPAIRQSKDGQPASQNVLVRTMRRFVPTSWLSNHRTKQRGLIRRSLRWIGASWLQSPARRLSQAICFLLFLVLFFWVCWPYTASPDLEGDVSRGWELVQSDQQSGELRLRHEPIPAWLRAGKARVYLVDAGNQVEVGAFQVSGASGSEITLHPERNDVELIRAILLATGDWTLRSQSLNAWPAHYADDLARKEWVPADLFLVIDPLVSISTAIASRQWVWSLVCAAIILGLCIWIPRGFCGYVCPLGTLIDLFDWSVGSRVTRLRVASDGWWVHIKYYLLLACLLCAIFGVLVTGYVAAIPVITRGMLLIGEPLQSGWLRGWHLVPPMNAGAMLSIVLFVAVLGLGLLQPRFWCKYVCPSGAVFSLGNLFRASERKVESSCIHCNKCVEVCPFDAIKPDFTTRVTDCTLCQTCGGACPVHAIKFVERGNLVELKLANDPPTHETSLGRRGFLSAAVGTAASVAGAALLTEATLASDVEDQAAWLPVRPPGSVPEDAFLQMCIRCGECFKACPNNVLQPMSFQQGLIGLWTPVVVADWAGCESSCNACGQVCPTGAIRALPLEEKRHARMGLAIVNESTCLPFANREACQLCVDECISAGYDAIEFTRVHTLTDEQGNPIEDSGYVAPVVLPEKCVGCGLCQTRCFGINVEQKGLLSESAIIVEAGSEYEDRWFTGSYAAAAETRNNQGLKDPTSALNSKPLPEAPPEPAAPDDSDNPFGI